MRFLTFAENEAVLNFVVDSAVRGELSEGALAAKVRGVGVEEEVGVVDGMRRQTGGVVMKGMRGWGWRGVGCAAYLLFITVSFVCRARSHTFR